MNEILNNSSNFVSLSIPDLIEARDLFHYHLMNKKNVVATAIGLYRIRKEDPWPSRREHKDNSTGQKPRRTLFNSEIRPYSWPCIYVFVSQWEKEAKLAEDSAVDIVPKTLYLPDGRSVPVCIIEARKQDYASDLKIDTRNLYPRNYFAPGIPVLNEDAQGLKRLSTLGCIVKDGEKFYALTNQHTIGSRGTRIKAIKGYNEQEIGITSSKQITRTRFKEVYPSFESSRQYR